MYTYLCIHVHSLVRVYVSVCLACMYAFIIYACAFMYVRIYECTHLCMYAFMLYACIYLSMDISIYGSIIYVTMFVYVYENV